LEASLTGRIEGALQRVVERPQADLIPGPQCSTRTDEMRPGAALLLGDDRTQDSIDRGVERLHDRVVLVEPAAIDLDYDLRPRPLQRRPLQFFEGVAPHLAVQMPRTRQPLMRGERRLVRRASRSHYQTTEPRGARRARRQWPPAASHGHVGAYAAGHLNLVVEQQRALWIRLGHWKAHQLDRA